MRRRPLFSFAQPPEVPADRFAAVTRWRDQTPSSEASEIGDRFRRRDSRATEEVRGRVERTLAFRGYGIPREDRRDLEQIVMAQLWEAVAQPGFDTGAGFWGFIEVVVARRCVDWLRGCKAEVPFEASHAGPDPSGDPQEAVLRRERYGLIEATLERLPEGCRRLIRLHLEQELTYAEAAEVLGTSEGALRVRMHRCIQRAQGILRELEISEKTRQKM